MDYSGQHLLLLYGLKGDEYYWLKGEGDPYAAKGLGETGRDLMKQVVLICVNAETRPKAIRAIRKEIVKNYPNFSRTNEFINPLIDATIEQHPELADSFFSGMWALPIVSSVACGPSCNTKTQGSLTMSLMI